MMNAALLSRFTGVAAMALAGCFVLAGLAHAQNNCIECHSTLDDEALSHPAHAMTEDVHAEAGVSCADCHGGDPTLVIADGDDAPAKASATGFVGAPDIPDVPDFCGRCHADASYMQEYDPDLAVDQLAEYQTSGHGTKLAEGATDVAVCVSCHGSHGMLGKGDPRSPVSPTKIADTCGACHADEEHMAPHDLETDQVAAYRESVHGRALYEGGDLSAPTCHTCHGNHGSTPSGVSSVALACGNCHAIQQELYAASPHRQAFEDLGELGCATCHADHEVEPVTDALLGGEDGQICGECHFDDEDAYTIAQSLRRDIDDLKGALAEAEAIVHASAIAGMEVSDAELTLLEADQALVRARNVVHAVSVDALEEQTAEGRTLAAEAKQLGIAALEELQSRRNWLVLFVFFLVLVVIGLYFKIRQIEKVPPQAR